MTDLLDRPATAGPLAAGGGDATTCHVRAHPTTDHGGVLRHALRPDADGRRAVDPGLAGGLRAWLEDGVAPYVAGRPSGAGPLVVDRWSAARLPPADHSGEAGGGRLTVEGARQAMVACLFRQLVVAGTVRSPFADAMAGLRSDGWGEGVVRFVSALPRATRQALRREVDAHGSAMAAGWPVLPGGWLPRTTARLCAPLAGGRVLVRATASLVLGAPPSDRSSRCLVDVQAGEPRGEHGTARRLLALVETVRSGAPPCRVATYYPATGHLDTEDPTDVTLAATVPAVVEAVRRRTGGAPGRR